MQVPVKNLGHERADDETPFFTKADRKKDVFSKYTNQEIPTMNSGIDFNPFNRVSGEIFCDDSMFGGETETIPSRVSGITEDSSNLIASGDTIATSNDGPLNLGYQNSVSSQSDRRNTDKKSTRKHTVVKAKF